MSQEVPEHREVWQESDGTLLLCHNPGFWLRFGSATPIKPNDTTIAYPLRRVFSKYGVPTVDDPVKAALLDDLALAQRDRDRWREKATWLSSHVTTTARVNRAGTEEEEQAEAQEEGFIPPPTEAPGGHQIA